MQRAKAAKLGVYRLSELLHGEAELLPVQLKLISHNKLKQIQRASSKLKQSKLFTIWDSYEISIINAHKLLDECCLLFKFTTPPDNHIDTLDRPGDTLELDPYDQDIELDILD